MKKIEEMTKDEILRKEYIELLSRHLKQRQLFSSKTSLSPEDKVVVEYHLKDVTRHAVKENTSIEECIAIFNGRIERLVKGDKEVWESTLELVRRHKNFVTQMTIVTIDDMFRHFTKRKTAKK